jgi:hypothetical protein
LHSNSNRRWEEQSAGEAPIDPYLNDFNDKGKDSERQYPFWQQCGSEECDCEPKQGDNRHNRNEMDFNSGLNKNKMAKDESAIHSGNKKVKGKVFKFSMP